MALCENSRTAAKGFGIRLSSLGSALVRSSEVSVSTESRRVWVQLSHAGKKMYNHIIILKVYWQLCTKARERNGPVFSQSDIPSCST